MRKILLASTSTLHNGRYLEYLFEALTEHFKDQSEILFIPYARPGGISYDDYTGKASLAFEQLNKKVVGIHKMKDVVDAISNAKAIFVGGGNTFVLVKELYSKGLILPLQKALRTGTPYLGTSAGSNICGLTMQTTNDMPIVYPPSFKTLGLVPFNINPHYLDPIPGDKHMGETRETRIKEFHQYNTHPVIGLREGSWLQVYGQDIILKGKLSARLFEYEKSPSELEPLTNLRNLS